MLTADQFTTYDLRFYIAMSTPIFMQNADVMYAFFCRHSGIADGVTRLSIYAWFPGSPGCSIFSASASSRMSEVLIVFVEPITAPRLAPFIVVNGCGRSSLIVVGGMVRVCI